MGVSPKFYDTPYKLLEKDNKNSQITISSWEMTYWEKTASGFSQINTDDLLDPEKDYKGLSSALPKIEIEQTTNESGATVTNYRLRPCSMYISKLDIYCLLIAKGKATSTETTDSTLWA
jgi:hypothetical protein